ncbi:MAG: LptE family protein [Bacteroidales bacterium]|nr:LptE family protein [Bacteroidales bacterium]
MKASARCIFFMLVSLFMLSCTIKYSAVGVDIPVEAKTIAIKPFVNNASLVNLKLSNTLTTQLIDKFTNSTRLSVVNSKGDLSIEGEITNYAISSVAVGAEMATMNRLTIGIRISYINKYDEEKSCDKTFSRYVDFDSKLNISQVEDALVSELCDALVDDIFSATVGNW